MSDDVLTHNFKFFNGHWKTFRKMLILKYPNQVNFSEAKDFHNKSDPGAKKKNLRKERKLNSLNNIQGCILIMKLCSYVPQYTTNSNITRRDL